MDSQSEGHLMNADIAGHGEPLVLLPGALTGWLSWLPHAEALADSWRVIRLQLLNVALGLAGAPLPPEYSTNYEVKALGKTLDKLAIEQADLAGWSLGADIILSYGIHHPERVRSLTLIEPGTYWILRSRGGLSEALPEQRFAQTLATDNVSEEQMIEFTHTVGLIPEGEDPRQMPQWPVWFKHRQSLRIGDTPFPS